jgi:hypothetical protein
MPLGAFKAALMGTAGVDAGADVVLLATTSVSSGSSISFTSGIDSTYGEYIFGLYNIHCEGNGPEFDFHVSIDGGSSYGVNKTSTYFRATHTEADATSLAYNVDQDVANATADQAITVGLGNENDESMHGVLHLFNPSSTTYVKHWLSRTTAKGHSPGAGDCFTGGYVNTTDNIDAVKFQFASNDFDGKIKMWGVK